MKPISSKKRRIYRAAAELFRDKGYAAASMRDLASKVGLEPSSLYSHIRSKQEILTAICFDCATRFFDGLEQIVTKHQSPADQLRALIRMHIDMALNDPTITTVFNDEWRHMDEVNLEPFLHLRKTYESKLIDILEAGMERGVFVRRDAKVTMYTMLSSIHWLHYRRKSHLSTASEDLTEQIITFIRFGIEGRKS